MSSLKDSPSDIRARIDEVRRFLSIALSIANAHTVEFYTHDVWSRLIAVTPEEVLSAISFQDGHQRAPERNTDETPKTTFGFCERTHRLVDIHTLLEAAKALSIPGLGVCLSRKQLMQSLRKDSHVSTHAEQDAELEPSEFMNSKKSHEVQFMSEVVSCLAQGCRVNQVIDVGSGKGYLCSFLSLRYGLQVYGIDSSSSNTHGAHERNRKLKRFSRAYQTHLRSPPQPELPGSADVAAAAAATAAADKPVSDGGQSEDVIGTAAERGRSVVDGCAPDAVREGNAACLREEEEEDTARLRTEEGDEEGKEDAAASPSESGVSSIDVGSIPDGDPDAVEDPEPADPFLGALPLEATEAVSGAGPPRAAPPGLSAAERERRKQENLARKAGRGARGRGQGAGPRGALYSPLTSYVTAETELRDLIDGLQDAVLVGLHTCGDLAPSTLRMFAAKRELASVCSVGCCYHLLTEEFGPPAPPPDGGVFGFPMSAYLREQSWFCGRNARMSACLALERVTVGKGIQMESLFFRAVLHVILRDHYDSFKSERRVGNVYSKSKSFVDYVRKALGRLDLDHSKLSDSVIQDYHEAYAPRTAEMRAFNMLKVILAPCIEGVVLLDRLCFLKEQEDIAFSALVQLFDPLLSPRCYAVVGVKTAGIVD
ncbi:LOW QUALITY PROTEIN: methyltransferase-like protein 25 [Gadus chalcogrammus]|uniref:LOW QUALITY PROTEIN: methyltransferase-like protein 25 n=1 Tax=Gadus chalcogrammus TaxID=1042646 RepID=UPI0024C4E58F|nr:LOW QUALITY PROTEIN: methyltransferase-like protein 25 [Gadus chalcogrammus]